MALGDTAAQHQLSKETRLKLRGGVLSSIGHDKDGGPF